MTKWRDLAGKKNSDSAMRESGFERVEGDRYWTESWVTRALLSKVRFRGYVWEPACGRGDIANVLSENGYVVMVSDIAGDTLGCPNASKKDFLLTHSPEDWKLSIITNPPFTSAEAFIRKALDLTARSSGMVAMLLRNEYDCAATRRELFEGESFAAKFVLTKRPKWADGIGQHSASPRHNFAWFLWDHNHSGPARIEWLP